MAVKLLYPINLQLFAGEKTEEATPRKKQQAREKGQVMRSTELNSAFILLLTFLSLRYFAPYIMAEISGFMRELYLSVMAAELTVPLLTSIFISVMIVMAKTLFPIMGVALAGGLLASYIQIGFLFTTEPLQVKLERIDPLAGFKRIFSKRTIAELLKSVFKIAGISYIAYTVLINDYRSFGPLIEMNIMDALAFIGNIIWKVTFRAGIFLLILAGFDYFYQRWEYNESLKMTKQEVKDEFKNIEGNPQLKAKIKEKQRQMAMQRMMQEVPRADVIVTNPTHFAVALKYDAKTMAAPVVVAKGADLVAQRIKEIAKEHNVATVDNKILARSLFQMVEIGGPVPADLYQAIAEVLAFVYRLKGKV